MFAGGGPLKLSGDPAMIDLFAAVGVGQWFRYAVGTAEIAGAVGLLIPRLSRLTALGLAGLMGARPPPTCSSSARVRGSRSPC